MDRNSHTLLLKIASMFVLLLLFTGFTVAQRTISGTVIDASNDEPLIGANILIKGTSTGTVTDIDGNYSLSVEEGDVLVFSYTGFQEQEITVAGQATIDVGLSVGRLLDEVVVIGYGTAKKSDLTGSVTSVDEEDFNKGNFTAPDQLIQGKVSGVQVLGNSGQPGAAATVRIRGNSSVRAGSTPLYVIDGVPLDGRSPRPAVSKDDTRNVGASPATNPLNFINPNDIASIEVLKDASATAIYGSRGANGVILITTKKGRTGDPAIDFSVSAGISNILKKYDVLSASEYRSVMQEYGNTTGDAGGESDALDEILRTGSTQNYNFSIGGGSQNGNYRISAGYLDQQGIIKQTGLKKYTGSINSSYKFLDGRLKIDFNLLGSHTTENIEAIGSNADFRGSLVTQALVWNPTDDLYDDDDKPRRSSFGNSTINPLENLDAYGDVSDVTTILGSISPSFEIADGLEYRFLYSVNHNVGNRNTQIKSTINFEDIEGRGFAKVGSNQLTTQQFTHTLSYNRDLNSSIRLNAVIGYEYQEFNNRGYSASGQDFVANDINLSYSIQNASQDSRSINSFADPVSELQSFFGRANFNINDKYLITGTLRADGSSKFGENNRYGYFPSLAGAWNISNEDFMAGGIFDQLKLRVGWGQTGNQEFPAGSAQERFALGEDGALFQENVANPDLQWETSTTLNAGIDFSLFDYKLSGSIEYFNKQDEDLLFNFQAIQPAPDSRYWINLPGTVVNSGIEVALNTFLVENENMTWQFGANASFLSNELKDYNGPPIIIGELFGQGLTGATSQRLENGQPLNAFYLRKFTGLSSEGTSEHVDGGNSLFFVGDPNPDVLLGISTSLTYGDLSVSLNFNGAFGHQIFNNTRLSVLPISNLFTRNIDASLIGGSVQESTSNANVPSDRFLESGDYLKLANATIGYDLGSIGNYVKNVRFFLTGQNLLVFTGFTGFDPEVNTVNEVNGIPSFGIEYGPYPSARTILFGVNFSF